MAATPKPPSPGEERLGQHLTACRIPFEREVRLVPERRWRWDFVVHDLAIEVQGNVWHKGGHSTGAGITRDCEKLNAAVLVGYRPLCFTTQMVMDGTAIAVIFAALKKRPK